MRDDPISGKNFDDEKVWFGGYLPEFAASMTRGGKREVG